MKLIFLRGLVPKDRDPKEIMYNSLEEETDMWTHLANGLGDERCEVLYQGGRYEKRYSETCTIRFVKSFKTYRPDFVPDVIISRGGFEEFIPFLKRFPGAYTVYYGAGKRYIPRDNMGYDLVLCDSPIQVEKLIDRKFRAKLFFKPAAPCFYPRDVRKKYDVCFVAPIPEDKRKNVKWVYETCPKHLKVLQLGYYPKKFKVPKNFTVKRIARERMPKAISKCKCVIAPYTEDDSGPRILTEALACGVQVVPLGEVSAWFGKLQMNHPPKKHFWSHVNLCLMRPEQYNPSRTFYEEHLSLEHAVNRIRRLIERKK